MPCAASRLRPGNVARARQFTISTSGASVQESTPFTVVSTGNIATSCNPFRSCLQCDTLCLPYNILVACHTCCDISGICPSVSLSVHLEIRLADAYISDSKRGQTIAPPRSYSEGFLDRRTHPPHPKYTVHLCRAGASLAHLAALPACGTARVRREVSRAINLFVMSVRHPYQRSGPCTVR